MQIEDVLHVEKILQIAKIFGKCTEFRKLQGFYKLTKILQNCKDFIKLQRFYKIVKLLRNSKNFTNRKHITCSKLQIFYKLQIENTVKDFTKSFLVLNSTSQNWKNLHK